MYSPYNIEKYPNRRNPRLKNFDYASNKAYFLTVCTDNKKCLFGNPEELNFFGEIAKRGLLELETHYSGIRVDKMVVMPNHIHLILVLNDSSATVSSVIGSFKSYVSREIHKVQPDLVVWQKSFHDHIIRNEGEYQKIWLYIEGNPQNWNKDCFYME